MTTWFKYTAPNQEELRAEFQGYKDFDDNFHLSRLKIWHEEFGPMSDLLFSGGIPAVLALHELELAFVMGLDLSTIMTAHIFIEQVLGAGFIITGQEKTAEAGLGSMVKALLEEQQYRQETLESIEELRKIRIAYFHSHEGLKKRGFMGRWIDSGSQNPYEFANQDSHKAIVAVANLIRDEGP